MGEVAVLSDFPSLQNNYNCTCPRNTMLCMGALHQRCTVSLNEPFNILGTSDLLLGYRRCEIYGRSILTLCGPWTDSLLLLSAISEALVLKPKIVRICLRNRDGGQEFCKVTCAPALGRFDRLEGCVLLFEREGNDLSISKISISSNRVSSASEKKTWPNVTTTGLCKDSSPSSSSRVDSCFSISIPQLLTPEKSLSIVPRQKRGTFPPSRLPVHLALDNIRTIQHLPLNDAADALGISVSAFRKACRELGVGRWPARRSNASKSPAATHSHCDLRRGASDDAQAANGPQADRPPLPALGPILEHPMPRKERCI